jgi:hypothetical protein
VAVEGPSCSELIRASGRDFLSLAILDLKGSFATYRDETERASIGHGSTGNKVVFPISHLDQRNGRRAFIPPALGLRDLRARQHKLHLRRGSDVN